jgi:hypothetical protein
LVFRAWGSLDLETGELVVGGTIGTATQRLFDIVDAFASGAFVPNQEKDELTYTLATSKHPGRMQGKGFMASWLP